MNETGLQNWHLWVAHLNLKLMRVDLQTLNESSQYNKMCKYSASLDHNSTMIFQKGLKKMVLKNSC